MTQTQSSMSMQSNGGSNQLNSMQDLFVDQLRDLYSAEDQLIQALPQMAQAATSKDLKEGFQKHLEQTREQKQRLERILSDLGKSPGGKVCKAMEGLIKEGKEVIQAQGDPLVKDAALIGAAQRVEHYEIAGYGTARTIADNLGHDKAKDMLQKTLDEEGETDKKLTSIAEGGMFKTGINQKAMS